jgi:hypothetical protein
MHTTKSALDRSILEEGLLYFILLQFTELLDAAKHCITLMSYWDIDCGGTGKLITR